MNLDDIVDHTEMEVEMDQSEGMNSDESKHNKIKNLKEEIEKYPYHLPYYQELQATYKEFNDIENLELCRVNMKSKFLLPPSFWLDWLSDKLSTIDRLVIDEEIKDLFEESLNDYLSIDIYLAYLNYLIEIFENNQNSSSDSFELLFKTITEAFSKALQVCNYHIPESCKVWNVILHFFSETLPKDLLSGDVLDSFNQLYLARLAVPHPEIETNFSSYSTFVSTYYPLDAYESMMKEVSSSYSNAKDLFFELETWENYLVESAYTYEAYTAYIDFLKTKLVVKSNDRNKKGVRHLDPKSITIVYERFIGHHPAYPEIWESYLVFLMEKLPLLPTLIQTSQRAQRACPWSGTLTSLYLRFMDQSELDLGTLHVCLNTKLLDTDWIQLNLVLNEMCAIYRRRLPTDYNELEDEAKAAAQQEVRKIFQSCTEYFYNLFPGGEPNFTLLQFWATVELNYFQDIDAARKVWSQIVRKHKNSSKAWLGFVHFEQSNYDLVKARGLFKQALRTLTDDPDSVVVAWNKFENEFGDTHSANQAYLRIYNQKIIDLQVQQQQFIEKAQAESELEVKKEKLRVKDRANKAKKRSHQKDSLAEQGQDDLETAGEKQAEYVTEVPQKRDRVEAISEADNKATNLESVPENHYQDEDRGGTTLFVANFSADVTTTQLRTLFSKFGEISEIRRPNSTAKPGTLRNFAYVQFKTKEEASNALQLHGHKLEDGKELKVALSNPKLSNKEKHKKENKEGSKETDTAKLFVANLPFSTDKTELLNMFSKFGPIQDIKVLTRPDGKSKGVAFVQFENKDDGLNALALNSTQLGDRIVSVAIADPNSKIDKGSHPEMQRVTKKFKAGDDTNFTETKAKVESSSVSAISFQPRSSLGRRTKLGGTRQLPTHSLNEAKKDGETKGKVDDKADAKMEDLSAKKNKSNEEFRKMFLK